MKPKQDQFSMSFPRKDIIPAVMPRSIIDSNDSLFNPKKVFTIIDPIEPDSSASSHGSGFSLEFYDKDVEIFKYPMSSTTNTTSSVDVDEEDVSFIFYQYLARGKLLLESWVTTFLPD